MRMLNRKSGEYGKRKKMETRKTYNKRWNSLLEEIEWPSFPFPLRRNSGENEIKANEKWEMAVHEGGLNFLVICAKKNKYADIRNTYLPENVEFHCSGTKLVAGKEG